MMQGCVSESSHIRAMAFASEKVKRLLFPLPSVLSDWNPVEIEIIIIRHCFERIPNKANFALRYVFLPDPNLGLRPSPLAAILILTIEITILNQNNKQ